MPKNFYESISIQNGGIVARCQECKRVELVRFVTEVCNYCPNSPNGWQDTTTYKLCDRCADCEKRRFENSGAQVLDGRILVSEFNRI